MIDRVTDNKFDLVSKYSPAGDQGQAIDTITKDFKKGDKEVILKVPLVLVRLSQWLTLLKISINQR